MNLFIDAGNSRIKWIYGHRLPTFIEAVSYRIDWRKKLYLSWHLLPEPQNILLSSVNSSDIETFISNICQKLWNKKLHTITAEKEQNNPKLTVAYKKPEHLGTDRYLAMLGARSLTNDNFCVIGCGTAITLDAVDSSGKHLGGVILPGIRLCENTLLTNTKRLKPMRWTANILGTDTAACIGAGIHHALPSGIEKIIMEIEEETSQIFQRFAFGGDAQILFGKKNSKYQIESDLVFRGMFAYLESKEGI